MTAKRTGISRYEGEQAARGPLLWVDTLDWSRCPSFLHAGEHAVVFRVARGVVAKVGNVRGDEVEAQRYLALQDLALPVFDYAPGVFLPQKVRRVVCGRHGKRHTDDETCSCHLPCDVLLMPRARGGPFGRRRAAQIPDLMQRIDRAMMGRFGRRWDVRPEHLALYGGHLVGLDFGAPG